MDKGIVSIHELLHVAKQAAREAGDYAMENRHRRLEVNRRTHHDVKLRLDLETQRIAEACLRRYFPHHSIFGEEWGELDRDAEYLWIVDPIDGSINFMQGLPYWCSSIAIMREGEVVAGAVYAAEQDECFSASIDGNATCNGDRIHVSETSDLHAATVCAAGLSRITLNQQPGFLRLLTEVGKIRVFGAAALDLCYVASGRFDALVEHGLNLWDVAAGSLIVRKAGGIVEKIETISELSSDYMASNGVLQEPLKQVLDVGGNS